MQTTLTLEQLRDLFYMEDRLGIVLTVTAMGSIQVPSPTSPMGSYFDNMDVAYHYLKGYFEAASHRVTLPKLESQ
jgi:hypothetical protein